MKAVALSHQFQQVRERTETLCEPLSPEDMVVQVVPYASPPKWHLAHTTWFFEEMVLKKYLKDYKEFHADFGFLFNSYYNHVGQRTMRTERGNMTRPTISQVLRYRMHVNTHVQKLLDTTPSEEVLQLIELGLNHEEQHQELLITDAKYTLGHNPLFPEYRENGSLVSQKNDENGFITVPEGIYEIGHKGDGFSFDNEHNHHKVFLPSYQISRALVTNADYLEFIKEGGYNDFRYWLDEGWSWVNENKVQAPLYWHFIDNEWYQYTLSGLHKIEPLDILSHISYYEANAFATWKGMRLPTEFEWEVAAENMQWGQRWEWTNSAYLPYPGFAISEGAIGEYNGKFMINQMVLRGASSATAPGHSRKTYRNFFHPHYQWQFSGIRLAKDREQ